MYSIGIDIGGMSIKAGLVKDGKIVSSNRKVTAPTSGQSLENLIVQINALLSENSLTEKDIAGIGIGCPGLISSEEGTPSLEPIYCSITAFRIPEGSLKAVFYWLSFARKEW